MNKYQEALELLKEYRIGEELNVVDKINYNARLDKIIDLLQELVDKATPKKVLFIQFHSAYFMSDCYHSGTCPVCKAENDNYYGDKYCRHCGQALDWSKDEI